MLTEGVDRSHSLTNSSSGFGKSRDSVGLPTGTKSDSNILHAHASSHSQPNNALVRNAETLPK